MIDIENIVNYMIKNNERLILKALKRRNQRIYGLQ